MASNSSPSSSPNPEAWGIGLRRPHFDEIADNHDGLDIIEIITENFIHFGGHSRSVLHTVIEQFPVIAHGVSLSIAGPDSLDKDFLKKIKDFLRLFDPPWYSDHLTYSSAFGVEYHDLIPFPFTEDALEHISGRVRQVQDTLNRPFLVENSSYYANFPANEMSEADFFCELMSQTGCAMLLDVNNVYVNATNHGYDARDFIPQLPRGKVSQYHMAGHDSTGPFLLDTHGDHVIDEVFELYKYTLEIHGPAWTILEWDNNIPTLDVYLNENKLVRAAANSARTDARHNKGGPR